MKKSALMIILILLVLLSGCNGDGDGGSPPEDVTGWYEGTGIMTETDTGRTFTFEMYMGLVNEGGGRYWSISRILIPELDVNIPGEQYFMYENGILRSESGAVARATGTALIIKDNLNGAVMDIKLHLVSTDFTF